MKILFRADGNGEIGAGHIMRCLAIAGKAKEQGNDCAFLTADDSYYDKIVAFGIRCIVLNSNYDNLESELPLFLKKIEIEKPDRIIVDSYYVTEKYLRLLKSKTIVAYIDDVAAFAYPVDILINYNIYGSQMNYQGLYEQTKIPIPKTLIGTQYVPLRKEFQNICQKEISDPVKNVLVSVGGSDPEHIIIKMIEYLICHEELTEDKKYHFVIGEFEPDREKIFSMALKYKWIVPHYRVKQMSELMLSCDVALSAAGSTLYELCACGIPTVTYILEDNQLGASIFGEKRIMRSAGDYRYAENWLENLFLIFENLCSDKQLRTQMKEKARKLVDGKGAENIIEALIKYSE